MSWFDWAADNIRKIWGWIKYEDNRNNTDDKRLDALEQRVSDLESQFKSISDLTSKLKVSGDALTDATKREQNG